MKSFFLPLVHWGMGVIIIGVFAIVCIIIVAVVMNMSKGSTKDPQTKE